MNKIPNGNPRHLITKGKFKIPAPIIVLAI